MKELFNEQPKKRDKYRIPGFNMAVKVPTADTPEGKRAAIEGALRTLKRMVKDAGIMEEVRERREFQKPSVKNRESKLAAQRRAEIEDIKRKEEDAKGL